VYWQTVSGSQTWCESEILKGISNSPIKQVFAILRGYAKFVFSFRKNLRLKKWLGTTDSNALVLVSQEKKKFYEKISHSSSTEKISCMRRCGGRGSKIKNNQVFVLQNFLAFSAFLYLSGSQPGFRQKFFNSR
jgi:hypothetical protein